MSRITPIRPGRPSTGPGGAGAIITPTLGGPVVTGGPGGLYETTLLFNRGRRPIYQVQLHTPNTLDPIAHWKLNETSGTRADSAGNFTLSQNGTLDSATGVLGNAANFESASSEFLYRAVAAGDTLQVGGSSVTICAAVYLESDAVARCIVSQYNDGSATDFPYMLYYSQTTDRFRFVINDGGSSVFVEADELGSPDLNTWYYIIAWLDRPNNTINIQVDDGTVDTAATGGVGCSNSDTDFRIGACFTGGSLSFFWEGLIDEVSLYKRVLNSAERTAKFNGGDLVEFTPATLAYSFCTSWPVGGEDLGTEVLSPISLDKSIDAENSSFPVSELIFDLFNHNNTALTAVQNGILGYQVKFYGGFYDLVWSGNYVEFFNGFVADVDFRDGTFRVTARGFIAKALDAMIFNGARSYLTADATDSDTSIDVYDASAFEDAADSPDSQRRLARCGDEILIYRAKTGSSLDSLIRPPTPFAVPPAFPQTVKAAHSAGEPVIELSDMGKLTGDNDETIGTNDQHPITDYFTDILTRNDPKRAIGEVGLQVDSGILSGVASTLGAELRFRFLYAEATNAKLFIEEQICQAIGGYPYETSQGYIAIKLYRSTASFSSAGDIRDEHVIETAQLLGNSPKLLNTVTYQYDHDLLDTADKEFASTFIYRDDGLRAIHGRSLELIIQARGVRSYYTAGGFVWFSETAAFLQATAQRHIARFGTSCRRLLCRMSFNRQLLNVADDITVNLSNVVDIDGGTTSIVDGKFELVRMSHNYLDGTIEAELLEYPAA